MAELHLHTTCGGKKKGESRILSMYSYSPKRMKRKTNYFPCTCKLEIFISNSLSFWFLIDI